MLVEDTIVHCSTQLEICEQYVPFSKCIICFAWFLRIKKQELNTLSQNNLESFVILNSKFPKWRDHLLTSVSLATVIVIFKGRLTHCFCPA